MAFRFPLNGVLHLRKSIEHQQELRVQAANQQVTRVRRLVEHLDRCIQGCRQAYFLELESGTPAAAVTFALEVESTLQAKRRVLELELLRVTHVRDQQQQAFQQARRDRETFEVILKRQLREYRNNQDRREQRTLDELFLLQQAFRKSG